MIVYIECCGQYKVLLFASLANVHDHVIMVNDHDHDQSDVVNDQCHDQC